VSVRDVVVAAAAAAGAFAWPPLSGADHGGALRPGAMDPMVEALIWAGGAFAIGVAIVAIVTVLARRRTPSK
jgi:hypothetical protein